MEKNRQVKLFAIVAIIIAVAGMSFSFATMSTNLDIKGSATMGSANWDVHFDKLSSAKLIGKTIEVVHPTITNKSTTISEYHVKFQSPNDGVQYQFDIVNQGEMDAILTTLVVPKPSCTGIGNTALSDATLVCSHLEYTLLYQDGTPVKIGDKLNKKETKQVQLKLVYHGSELPIEEVKIDNLGIVLIYSQN